MKNAVELKRQADYVWHVWINKFAHEQQEWPRSLYEFKDLLEFLRWGQYKIAQAFTATLPDTHQQCSQSQPEPIKNNAVRCALGQEVTSCPILVSLKATFEDERNRTCGTLGKFYSEMPDAELFRLMTNTCAWHIYRKVTENGESFNGIDTSEGHLMDEGDRRYWQNVYQSLAAGDPEDGEDSADNTLPEANAAGDAPSGTGGGAE